MQNIKSSGNCFCRNTGFNSGTGYILSPTLGVSFGRPWRRDASLRRYDKGAVKIGEARKKMKLDKRITFNPRQCGGRPCIRGMRIRVSDILALLAEGIDEKQILADFLDLEQEDVRACLKFAAMRVNIPRLAA